MKHFKAFKEYMDDATARLCIFDRTFKPWKKWENVNLTNLNPCKDCPISKELSENGHYYQICGGALEDLTQSCHGCSVHARWTLDVVQKLKWYEEQDKRLKGD